jgi:methionyl-tRNA formyltransferase
MAPRFVFAGDRAIAVRALRFLIEQQCPPLALLYVDGPSASHATELRDLARGLIPAKHIIPGSAMRTKEGETLLRELAPEYVIGIHFPHLIPSSILRIPKRGFLNLHPAYLPFNRGWHTPSWAIMDGTPYGATLHFMTEKVDTGDIVAQKQLKVLPGDTADSLYQRVLDLEYEVFTAFWPHIVSGSYTPIPQDETQATAHSKKDLAKVQCIDLDATIGARELIDRLRALTTNNPDEAAYFEKDGIRYYIRVSLTKGPATLTDPRTR